MQRRAGRWILHVKEGELSDKKRLIQLDLLPLTHDHEIRDLAFPGFNRPSVVVIDTILVFLRVQVTVLLYDPNLVI